MEGLPWSSSTSSSTTSPPRSSVSSGQHLPIPTDLLLAIHILGETVLVLVCCCPPCSHVTLFHTGFTQASERESCTPLKPSRRIPPANTYRCLYIQHLLHLTLPPLSSSRLHHGQPPDEHNRDAEKRQQPEYKQDARGSLRGAASLEWGQEDELRGGRGGQSSLRR